MNPHTAELKHKSFEGDRAEAVVDRLMAPATLQLKQPPHAERQALRFGGSHVFWLEAIRRWIDFI